MRRKAAIVAMALGCILIIGAAGLMLYNQWDDNRAAQAASEVAEVLSETIGERTQAKASELPSVTPKVIPILPTQEEPEEIPEMPVESVDGIDYIGVLEIPALELSLPVIESWSYSKLRKAPCRFSGNVYADNMVIMAHNYKRHFGKLQSLISGDVVKFVDVEGTEFFYEVALIETVNPNGSDLAKDAQYDMTLFTCTYNGKARVALRCVRAESD